MRKLESDIKRATKKYEYYKCEYEKARNDLQNLIELKEVEQMDKQGVRPNLINVMQYGAYLHGVQMGAKKILNDWFKMKNAGTLGKKEGRLELEAVLELVLKSKLNAERWISESTNMMLEPVERDKKGNVTKYKASFYVESTVRTKIS